MDINDLLFKLTNPSRDENENHAAMAHAARLINLMRDRIAYISDTNVDLQNKVDALSLDLGLKDQGYIK